MVCGEKGRGVIGRSRAQVLLSIKDFAHRRRRRRNNSELTIPKRASATADSLQGQDRMGKMRALVKARNAGEVENFP
jgi:hypothetical protein